MKYIKSIRDEELDQLREIIKMIFVDLIDDGFSVQIITSQRLKYPGSDDDIYMTTQAFEYDKCNVVYVRLVRFKDIEEEDFRQASRTFNNKVEIYKDKILNCFNILLSLLNKRWDGSKVEKIVREDAVTCQSHQFFDIDDDEIWKRDFNSIAITIIKKNL